MLTIAIGDIHGMFHALEMLLEHIDCFIETKWRNDRFKLIFLGDYIDRGPHSKQVIKKLRSLESENYICLKGNHEEMILNRFLAKQKDALSGQRRRGDNSILWRIYTRVLF
jgi:serine/threonine protein phosphatase 1